jgi:hypothetical protein
MNCRSGLLLILSIILHHHRRLLLRASTNKIEAIVRSAQRALYRVLESTELIPLTRSNRSRAHELAADCTFTLRGHLKRRNLPHFAKWV